MVKIIFLWSTNDRLDGNRPLEPQLLRFKRFEITIATIEKLGESLSLFESFGTSTTGIPHFLAFTQKRGQCHVKVSTLS